MTDKTAFDTAALDPVDRYKLMTGLIVPRPIGWVGSIAADGRRNLAPYSFFNMVAGVPPTVIFAPGRTQRVKDTLANVAATGEFTLNMVTQELAEAMNLTSGEYGSEVDEFEVAQLTPISGDVVAAPMVAEAKANLECRVTQIVDVGEPPTASVVFGEVLRIHVRTDLLDGTRVDHRELRAVGRMAGDGYATTAGGLFQMKRPVIG